MELLDPFGTKQPVGVKSQERAPQSPDPAAISQLLQLVMGQPQTPPQPLGPFAPQQFTQGLRK